MDRGVRGGMWWFSAERRGSGNNFLSPQKNYFFASDGFPHAPEKVGGYHHPHQSLRKGAGTGRYVGLWAGGGRYGAVRVGTEYGAVGGGTQG